MWLIMSHIVINARAHTSHLEKVNQTLHPIQIPIKTMSMISIDLLKLKEYKEYNYVITAVYYFTKYIEMGCLKQKCTKEVTKWISTISFVDTESVMFTLQIMALNL